jgi:HlyD family secretion protein
MHMHRIPIIALTALALWGCQEEPAAPFHGYAEGEYVLVASPYAGQLEILNVARGEQVQNGAELFKLEQGNETAARNEAEEHLREARARLDNLRKGQRPPEIDALRAGAAQIEAARALSMIQLKREQQLFDRGVTPQSRLDEARTNLKRDEAQLAQVQAQIKLALQSVGRAQEVEAAQAEVDAARAVLEQAQWRLDQKTLRAPVGGLVHDTFYVQGEWVPAGKPIVSLLPPANIKLRFFVPETDVGKLHMGEALSVRCDGCGASIPAQVSYVSTQPEYTPPVIYSRDERARLVFMVEARPAPAQATRLKPGQPVDIRFAWQSVHTISP